MDESQKTSQANLPTESVLRQASEIIGDSNRLFDEQVSALLEVVREAVGTDYATLSRVPVFVDDEEYGTLFLWDGDAI